MRIELEEELKDVKDPRYKPIRAIHHTLRYPALVEYLAGLFDLDWVLWDGVSYKRHFQNK